MLSQDLKLGLRSLRRQPLVSLLAILTLGLGIGATTTIFTVVHAVLLTPLPYPGPEDLMRVYATKPGQGIERAGLAGADFVDFAESLESFEHLGAYRWFGLALSEEDRPREIATILMTPGLLAELGTPFLGRTFAPEEGRPGEGNVVVLSYGLWQSQFGDDETIFGRTLLLDNAEYTVIGVMAPGLLLPRPGNRDLRPVDLRSGRLEPQPSLLERDRTAGPRGRPRDRDRRAARRRRRPRSAVPVLQRGLVGLRRPAP